jgi:hypothetical protein
LTLENRVQAVAEFGFTERQARFLVTVMLYAGVCVPRQYARFAGTAYGHKVNAFFDRLVRREYATACGCVHNRARLYHVRHAALYRAIGEPDSPYRRPVPARQSIDRVMLLDGVISHPEFAWLATEQDKVAFFTVTVPTLPAERLPHLTVGAGAARRVRLFPDKLPIGVQSAGRVVLLYLVTTSNADDFRAFLQRHADLLRALPEWTLRLLFLRHTGRVMASYQAAARDELTARFSPDTLNELKWYFEQRRTAKEDRTRSASDERFWQAARTFSTARCRRLYRRWMMDGDAAVDLVSSTAITDALARGTGRIESEVLLFPYDHLSPLVRRVRSLPSGVNEATDKASAGPQPPSLDAADLHSSLLAESST